MPEPTKLPVQSEKASEIAGRREWALFDRLRADVDHLLDQLGAGFPFRLPGRPGPEPSGWPFTATTLSPAVDVVEKTDAYIITAELPGLDEKDIEVKLVNGMLVGPLPDSEPQTPLAYYVAVEKSLPEAGRIKAGLKQLRDRDLPVTFRELPAGSDDLPAAQLGELARWIDMLDRI